MPWLLLLGLVVIFSVLSTTKQDRDEARSRLAKYNWHFGIAAAALWIALLWDAMPWAS